MQYPSTFTVYNASAGSGKTFTLVKEYLKVLLTSQDIFTFQKVLAITFTNKAAGEMKERVMQNLHAFSEGKSTDILEVILKETTLEKEIVVQRSQKILQAILQNYSAFAITTIDSFTHKIIKSFAYDLDLSLNFEVELDAQSLLNEAVEVLISKIGTNQQLTKLLIDYSLERIDDDKSWDITSDLNEFASILLNEDDVPHFRTLATKKLSDFSALKSKLHQHQQTLRTAIKKVGFDFLNLLDEYSLSTNDFYKGTIPKFFIDVANKGFDFSFLTRSETIKKAIENHQYYTKSTLPDTAQSIESIVPNIVGFFEETKSIFGQFLLNNLALKSIIPLAVLNNVNNELNSIKEDNNLQLNAELNQLISDYLQIQPAAFIYERIGQRFQHYFIDEMQDTSVLQWQNLIPLIANVLAQENSNLFLVGDGKQAIYRWRGGKAEQFINLSSKDENPFQIEKKKKNLQTNFRSFSEVIAFNNSFFKHAANFLQNESYKNLYEIGNNQHINSKNGGYVTLSFIEKVDDKDTQELRFAISVLNKIKDLQNDFSLGEICVLTRKRKEGILIANYLTENGIPIVSSETLLLHNSPKVRFIVDVLKLIQNPEDEEAKFEILYFLHHHLEVLETKNEFIRALIKQEIPTLFKNLTLYHIYFDIAKFYQLPFYEKVEEIVRSFKLVETSDAYIQFFLDVILEQQRKGIAIANFLTYWELKKDKLSIVASEQADAVQIMTIHKSKGLEFPVVIFPCDLDIYRQIKPKIWLDDLPKYFEGFEELLVSYNKDLEHINARSLAIYHRQREELELDNINLLYVALTRAVEQLHIITDKNLLGKAQEENLKYYSGFFINYLKSKHLWVDDQLIYEFGHKKRVSKKPNKSSASALLTHFISNPLQNQNLVMVANVNSWDLNGEEAKNFGILIHAIFEKIITSNDVDKVLFDFFTKGYLTEDNFEDVKEVVYNVVSHPKLKSYYQDNFLVYNEREIVDLDRQVIIPDRLVFHSENKVTIIDYKTGTPDSSHHQQIIKYQKVLESMQIKVTKKVLIYINDKIEVIEVSSKK